MGSVKVTFHFIDYSGKKSECRFRASPSQVDYLGGVSFMQQFASVLGVYSNAAIYLIEVTHEYKAPPVPGRPTPESDIYAKLLLFFGDESARGSISIPSPTPELPYDVDGPYRATRIERAALAMSGLLGGVQDIVRDTILPDGRPFPAGFAVGSLTRNKP